jgi:hypothetical protein
VIAAVILHAPNESAEDAELSVEGFADIVIRVDYPLGAGGFAELRNIGLDRAREAGADWALMLDADERLIWDGVAPELDHDVDAYDVESVDMYRSPKLISRGRFVGLVHEYLDGAPRRALLPGASFAEVPKDVSRIAAKIARDRSLLERQIRLAPESMRWPFYMGETERLAKDWILARHWYHGAAMRRESSSDWHREQAAWSLFKSARCGWDSGKWDPVEDLSLGLVHCPWMLELPWFAAWVRWRQGERQDARAWLRLAFTVRGTGPERRGFREDGAQHLEALQEAIG